MSRRGRCPVTAHGSLWLLPSVVHCQTAACSRSRHAALCQSTDCRRSVAGPMSSATLGSAVACSIARFRPAPLTSAYVSCSSPPDSSRLPAFGVFRRVASTNPFKAAHSSDLSLLRLPRPPRGCRHLYRGKASRLPEATARRLDLQSADPSGPAKVSRTHRTVHKSSMVLLTTRCN
jgi:hypothetical protein